MQKKLLIIIVVILTVSFLIGCAASVETPVPDGTDTPEPTEEPDPTDHSPTPEPAVTEREMTYAESNAYVDAVQIAILESFPVQVQVTVEGNLPDGCSEIDDVTVEREGDNFSIMISARRPTNMECTEALVPFSETISLDVQGLAAGTYTVKVHGIEETFTLGQDNELPPPGMEDGEMGELQIKTANVDAVSVQYMEGEPNAFIYGYFSDGCTSIHETTDRLEGSTVYITVTAQRPKDAMCTQAIVQFEYLHPLTSISEPGTYTVIVNDGMARTEFTHE